jgi:hypothetical protein
VVPFRRQYVVFRNRCSVEHRSSNSNGASFVSRIDSTRERARSCRG